MSSIAFFGAIESGLLFGLVTLGVFISFRVLDFPDLTVDGSLPLGAAVAATLIVHGAPPVLATLAAMLAGAGAGFVTAWLNVRLKILNLLASILTMIALYSVNLRIMGRPNVALLGVDTVFTPVEKLHLPYYLSDLVLYAAVCLAATLLLVWFLNSQVGLAMRATGANARMARAQGINTSRMTLLGMALSNALVALAGALFAQSQGGADVSMGIGVIVTGLAAVILGEAILPTRTIWLAALACVGGSILYRMAVALALNASFIGLQAQDLKLITAVLVALAMTVPSMRGKLPFRRGGKA
ncbi:beta-methylgalactoside transporter inner membrane component [mine drainage metagenome]|uniref:Beta-methylgalactoside transporter inner membrane component n=1 Tax=mine drainage metagenome TaxID=410659 RepID=A0A1J5QW94_9ZZZZ